MDHVADGIITIDQNGTVESFNPAAERVFGYAAAEVIGRNINLLMPEPYHSQHDGYLAAYRRTGQAKVLGATREVVGRRMDGSTFPLEMSAREYDLSGSRRFIGIVRDITARKQADERLRESEERLRHALDAARLLSSIVDSSDDAIISKSLDGVIQSWNTAAERLFGYTAEEAIGQPVTLLIPAERRSEEDSIIARIRAGESVENFDTVRVRKNGDSVPVSLTISPVRDEQGRVIRASKIARNVTERKRAEEQLREGDRQKDEFLATLAHELRNPLAPIRNGLQVMKLAGDDAEAVERTRSMIERQLEQMVRLVDDLMDVSRITRGKVELKKQRVRLAVVVSSAVETSRPLIDQMGHGLTIAVPKHPIILDADPTRLSQVFMNLLTNAAKYSERGGHVWLTVERQGSDVVVSVRDTGIGIDADKLPNIFEMFSQVDHSLEKAQGGLGIGLCLVKRLVEMHGGNVEAKSGGAGKGSEFVVRLPVVVEASVPPPDDRDEPAAPKSSLRILIVDDNKDGADTLAMMLKIMGNDTRTAYDGKEGVEQADQYRPDVALFDIGLPKLNGYDACRRIRGQPWGKSMVLIAVTGWGQDEDRRRSHDSGFDYHMVKPVNPQALMKLLAELSVVKR